MSQQTSWDELSELVIGHREKPELEEQPSTATILVIDDVASVGDSFESLFRGSGRNYKVIMALSGEEGVEKFKRDKPDVVTIDLIMPGMNGVEVYKALHEIDPRFQGMFVTGFPNSVTNVIEVAKLYGAIGFFEKTAFDVEDEVKLNNFLESVDKGIKNSKRIAWERDYVKAIQAGEIGKPPIWLDTIIGGEKNGKAFEADYRDIRLVTAANDNRKAVAAFRDSPPAEVDLAIECCKDSIEYYKNLSADVMNRLYELWAQYILHQGNPELSPLPNFDYANAAVLNGPMDVITRDRYAIARDILLSNDYLEFMKKHPQRVNSIPYDVSTAFVVVNASMRATPAYAYIRLGRRRISRITRPESARPIPAYEGELAFHHSWKRLQGEGLINSNIQPPSQLLFWDNRVHRDEGGKISKALDMVLFMGHPLTAWYMIHGHDFRLKVNTEQAGDSLKKLRKGTPLPKSVLYYVSNKTIAFLGGDGLENDIIDKMIPEIGYSCRSHDLSCKRAICLTVEDRYYDHVQKGLVDELSSYRIGEVGDEKAQIVRKTEEQWEEVLSYCRVANEFGDIVLCGQDRRIIKCEKFKYKEEELKKCEQSPIVVLIENPGQYIDENAPKYSLFRSLVSMECKHPVMILTKGSKELSYEIGKLMASRNEEGRNLQRYLYTIDDGIKEFFTAEDSPSIENPELIRTSVDAYDLHWWGDGSATDGLGNLVDSQLEPVENPRYRAHEAKMF